MKTLQLNQIDVDMKTMTSPFNAEQALVAIELGATDDTILHYLEFLTTEIPIKAAYFLHVLPALDNFYDILKEEGTSLTSNYELNTEVIEQLRTKIKHRIKKSQVNFDVRQGDPLEELLKDAEEMDADLIVIGQLSGAVEHGILARNLVRKAECNTLVIPEFSKPSLRKILVPIDFSSNSGRALEAALAIAKELKEPAEIICTNVYEMPSIAAYRIRKTTEELNRIIEEDRLTLLRDFVNNHVDADHTTSVKVVVLEKGIGSISSHLLDYADENDVDLIVIGNKGHSKVELLLLGSVTESLLAYNERIPTLVIK